MVRRTPSTRHRQAFCALGSGVANVLLMRLSGLVSHRIEGGHSCLTVVVFSRGDRNRNARLSRLRAAVPTANAIVGIDVADRKQMLVVTDHDSQVLARRTFRCKAWDLGAALDWASERAHAKGFASVTVACEPTGHRWMVLAQLAAERGMAFVCVQPAASSWARKTEDLTTDKTDDKDAVLIARLTGSCAATCPNRSTRPTRPGPGCGTSAPAATGCSRRTSRPCRRSGTCSSACGPPRWRPRSTRSARPPSWPPWPSSSGRAADMTAGTWTARSDSGWPGSSGGDPENNCGITTSSTIATALGHQHEALSTQELGRGEPSAALRTARGISSLITGRPVPSSTQPDHTLPSTTSLAVQGPTTRTATPPSP